MAAFFSGLANQAQSMVADKLGKGEAPAEGAPAAEVQLDENGEPIPPVENAGAFGFMGGIMAKANAVKEAAAGAAQQAGAGNLQGMMGGGGGTAENPEGYVEGQEYTENGENGEQNGEQNGQPAQSVGFAAGLMMKAHSLKEGVKEKGAGMNLGNVQGMTGMVGGVMGNVQGLIPGMKREEEVPDPAVPAEGEYAEGQYAEYTEEQYAEGAYTEEQYAQ